VPLEVQAGMDVNRLQERYGRHCVWMQGVHKSLLAGGRAAIATELERVKPAVLRGGYIPMLDHNIPAEVSLRNYIDYLNLKRDILGIGRGVDGRRILVAATVPSLIPLRNKQEAVLI